MKKILSFLVLMFLYLGASSQVFPVNATFGSPSSTVLTKGIAAADSGYQFRTNFADTTTANYGNIDQVPGVMIRTGSTLWIRNQATTAWVQIGTGAGGSGTVTSVTAGYGLSGGTITTSGTVILDTTVTSGLYLRRKDSLAASNLLGYVTKTILDDSLNIRVRYTDTAGMLTPYTRVQRFLDSVALMMRKRDSFTVSNHLGYLTQYSPRFTGDKLLYGGLHINPGPTYDTSWVVMSSQSLPWMFFMNGQANKIGINNGYPATTFHIKNSENESAPLLVENNSFNTGVQVQVTGPMPGIAFNNTDGLRVFAKVPGTNDFEIFNTAAYGAGTSFHKWFADGSYSNLGSMSVGNLSLTSSAQLAVNSTTKGLLPPRLTTTQRDAITSPAFGLMIYNTTDSAYQFYRASGWAGMGGGSDGNNYTTGITFTQSSRLLAIQRSGLSDVSVTLPNATSALSGMMSGSDKARLDSNSYLTIDKRYDSLAWRRNDSTFLVKSLRLQLNGSTITPTTTDSSLSYNILTTDTTTVPLITFSAGAGFAADTTLVTDSTLMGSLYTGQYEFTITKIQAVIKGNSGDSVVLMIVYNDSFNVLGTKVTNAGLSVSSRVFGNTFDVYTNRTVPANQWLWIKPQAVIAGKKPKYISVTLLGYKTYVAP